MAFFVKRRHGLLLAAHAVLGVLLVPIAASAAMATGLGDFPGVWRERGYGTLMTVDAQHVVRYDLTDIHCLRVEDLPLVDAAAKMDRFEVTPSGLTLFEAGGITRYAFERLAELPQRCRSRPEDPVLDPELNFAVLWQTFRENYAFFALHEVDWGEIYERFRPQLNASSGDAGLFQALSGMLGALNDGHVSLNDGVDTGGRHFGSGAPGELRRLWMAEHSGADEKAASRGFVAAARAHVVQDVLKGRKLHEAVDGALGWGWIAPGIGYLNVSAMAGDATIVEHLRRVREGMAQVLRDLRGARALIVDARFNGGGWDAMSLQIMGYLTDQKRVAFTKKAVDGAGFTEVQPVYFEPATTQPYTGPIYYLQSGDTVSAAEIFTLAMMARPKTTRIGTPTYGVFSDMLGKRLPNGWQFSLSNEVYEAIDGKVYEGRGVPPDVAIDASQSKDFRGRLQLDIHAALQLARKAGS